MGLMFDTPALGLVEEDYSTKLLNKHSHHTFTLEPNPCDVDQLLQSQHSLLCAETRLSQRQCSRAAMQLQLSSHHIYISLYFNGRVGMWEFLFSGHALFLIFLTGM